MSQLLEELRTAGTAGDSSRVRAIATLALTTLSPSGILAEQAARADYDAEFDALTARFRDDAAVLAHLDCERLRDRLEDDFAKAVPIMCDAAVKIEDWAIPILSALAGAFAPLLSVGLVLACKLALAALRAWAEKRLENKKKGGF